MLKLSDGRKRSMSLWIESHSASGYLSTVRKMRAKLQTLTAPGVRQIRDCVKMIGDTTEVKMRIRDRYIVQVTLVVPLCGCGRAPARCRCREPFRWPMPSLVLR